MLSYQEAVEVVLQTVQPLPPVKMALPEALGRVLAEPAVARWDLPPADNSAMDGYAFAWNRQGEGSELEVVGFVPAGSYLEEPVPPGRAVRIMTGAPLPAGCDTVVPVEEVAEEAARIRIIRPPRAGQHVRRRGEELGRGEALLDTGMPLHAGEMGLLAAAGIEQVKIYPAPRVALLSTGDELVELGEVPGPGQIVNSNFHLLAARLKEEGSSVIPLGVARDNEYDLAERVGRGLQADMLISTGGVSVGDRDYVQETLRAFGFQLGFWQVSIKPGKPVLFGTVKGRPVFGLPGNPAAAAATFELFVRPALRRLAGFSGLLQPRLRATLTAGIDGGEKRQRFIWGSLLEREGRFEFTPSSRQGSGQNRSLQGVQALLPVAGGHSGLAAGAEVEIMLVRLPPGHA
ncbi:MAG TPA: gephyrin-like molybdotransferase Glp [Desulfuromonadales bacterium]|nr:gephyrin-like molybdotransferase Glp [Desulfuromonadales bacterium]